MRRLFLALSFLLVAPLAAHEPCNLSMTMSCPPLRPGVASTCSATTVNNGSTVCDGDFITIFLAGAPPAAVRLTDYNSGIGLTECFDQNFLSEETDESTFTFCIGPATLPPGSSFTQSVKITPATTAPTPLPVAALTAVYDPVSGNELGLVYVFNDVELTSCTVTLTVPPITQSGVVYTVSWTAASDTAATYVLEESTTADFSGNVTAFPATSSLSRTIRHDVASHTTYYYRVRPAVCAGNPGPFSNVSTILVQAPLPPQTKSADVVVPFGSTTPVGIPFFVPNPSGKDGIAATSTFTATTDKSYLTVTPSSGTLPPGGTTVTVTANPSNLPPGANTGTVIVNSPISSTPVVNAPVSLSLVTPVSTGGKSGPPPNSLIIPAVTHATGGAGPFVSDVRLTNATSGDLAYQVFFTQTATEATQNSKRTTITVSPGQTIALNDIVKDFFGLGATGAPNDFGFGPLEIRPLNTSSALSFASSRTYAITSRGTFGQFVAAVPFAKFASRSSAVPGGGPPAGPPMLSLQQVAESAKFRTHLGIVEGSGQPVSGRFRLLNNLGVVLREIPYTLRAGEHQQFNNFISRVMGVPTLEDGRIEVVVDSPTGAVTAYASVLDNLTTDPLAVTGVDPSTIRSARYVLPGVAEFGGSNNFHTDARVFNGGNTSVTVTPTFYGMNNPSDTVVGAPLTIGANQVRAIDGVLPSLFPGKAAGAVLFSTPQNSSLVVTGRTYTLDAQGGTFGQFVPAITPGEGTGTGDRPLQLLQLEQSQSYRTNMGLVELTGNAAKVRVTFTIPDSRVSPVVEYDLRPNEYRQENRILEQVLGSGVNAYNVRASIEVIGGSGRVAALVSVLDAATLDPTYVPSQ